MARQKIDLNHLAGLDALHASGDLAMPDGTLLIYAPVPLFRVNGKLFIEHQATNGIRLWAQNFGSVIVMMPLAIEHPNGDWVEMRPGLLPRNVRIEVLPGAYRADVFVRRFQATRQKIRMLIEQADYLSFAIGGLIGDWGAVACLEASRMNRRFAVWTDRVESEVVRRSAMQGRLRSRLRARLTHRPMAWLERAVIRRASLGLFHGRETYDAYAGFSVNPHIVHDIHLDRRDHLDQISIRNKVDDCSRGPLRLCYVGRADAMKAPLEWIATLERLASQNVDFRATWLGKGDLYNQLRSRIEMSGLARFVEAPGFVADRQAVLNVMRQSHAFLFCHITPESPRCLIEALVSACPLIGYGSAFAEDLIAGNGGGELVPIGHMDRLADKLANLGRNRAHLGALIARAAADGAPYDDLSVFRHRSDLIRTELSPTA